jgi:O-antigen/teichoic acid export membrane protein
VAQNLKGFRRSQSFKIMGTQPIKSSLRMRTRVLQNTAALLGGRGLSIVLAGGASIILARYLGGEKLGEFGAIYAYATLFGWLATFGIDTIMAREASIDRNQATNILRTGTRLCLIFAVGATILSLVIAPFVGYKGHLHFLLIFAVLEMLLLSPLRLSGIVFQVDLKQWYSAGINLIRQGIWLLLVVVLAWLQARLITVIVWRFIVAALESILIWGFSRRFLTRSSESYASRSRFYLASAIPIAFSSLLAAVYFRIDQVMLHNMATDSILGQYVAAVRVSEMFEMIPAALIASLVPILSVSAADTGALAFRGYLDRTFRYFSVLACAICVVTTMGAGPIVNLLYGKQFAAATPLLRVLIWSEVSIFFGTVMVAAMVASNLQKYLLVPTAVGALSNVALNLYLIPRYAALGAAWATLISYSLAWFVVLLAFRQTRSLVLQGLRWTVPALALALGTTWTAALLPGPAVVKFLVGIFLYAAGIGMTRLFGREDIEYAWAALEHSQTKPG